MSIIWVGSENCITVGAWQSHHSHWFSSLPHWGLRRVRLSFCSCFKLQKVRGSCQKGGFACPSAGPCIFHFHLWTSMSTHKPDQHQAVGPADNRSSKKWRNAFKIQISSQSWPKKANSWRDLSRQIACWKRMGQTLLIHQALQWDEGSGPRRSLHRIRHCLLIEKRG